ncbi:MAG: hypothetical protein RIR01_1604 [Bacteroidota bacterium]|jgi:hypothetical protein
MDDKKKFSKYQYRIYGLCFGNKRVKDITKEIQMSLKACLNLAIKLDIKEIFIPPQCIDIWKFVQIQKFHEEASLDIKGFKSTVAQNYRTLLNYTEPPKLYPGKFEVDPIYHLKYESLDWDYYYEYSKEQHKRNFMLYIPLEKKKKIDNLTSLLSFDTLKRQSVDVIYALTNSRGVLQSDLGVNWNVNSDDVMWLFDYRDMTYRTIISQLLLSNKHTRMQAHSIAWGIQQAREAFHGGKYIVKENEKVPELLPKLLEGDIYQAWVENGLSMEVRPGMGKNQKNIWRAVAYEKIKAMYMKAPHIKKDLYDDFFSLLVNKCRKARRSVDETKAFPFLIKHPEFFEEEMKNELLKARKNKRKIDLTVFDRSLFSKTAITEKKTRSEDPTTKPKFELPNTKKKIKETTRNNATMFKKEMLEEEMKKALDRVRSPKPTRYVHKII